MEMQSIPNKRGPFGSGAPLLAGEQCGEKTWGLLSTQCITMAYNQARHLYEDRLFLMGII